MKTLNLEKQAQKLRERLELPMHLICCITTENGFVKVTHIDGDIKYFAPDLERHTPWAKSITIKNDIVITTLRSGDTVWYTMKLRRL